MHNSTIKIKYGKCEDCGKDSEDKPLIAKRCQTHYKIYRTKIRNQKQKLQTDMRKLHPKEDSLQTLWYLARKFEMTGICSEEGCNESTNKDHPKYYRWSVCHIVPKSLVPSVATNFLNFMEWCQTHHFQYDKDFESAAKLKSFKEARRKFGLFSHLIPRDELRRVNPKLIY